MPHIQDVTVLVVETSTVGFRVPGLGLGWRVQRFGCNVSSRLIEGLWIKALRFVAIAHCSPLNERWLFWLTQNRGFRISEHQVENIGELPRPNIWTSLPSRDGHVVSL